jgi:hypothetical protein
LIEILNITFFISQVLGSHYISDIFKPARNAPDAWGDFNISAGWVSDVDLYRRISPTSSTKKRKLLHRSNSLSNLRTTDISEVGIGSINSILRRLNEISSASRSSDSITHYLSNTPNNASIVFRSNDIPQFLSGNIDVDHCDIKVVRNIVQVLNLIRKFLLIK